MRRVRLVVGVALAALVMAGLASAAWAVDPPRVTGISPGAGPVAGGTQVILHGSGFTGTTSVRFGRTVSTHIKVPVDGELRVFSPRHGAGTVYVTVLTDHGTSRFAAAGRFAYVAQPATMVRSGPGRPAPRVTFDGGGRVDLSCVSAAFCAAGGSRGVAVFSGGAWRGFTSLADRQVTAVSCGSPTLCVAATVAGALWRYDGANWSLSRTTDAVLSVSCGGLHLCAAGTVTGTAASLEVYDGASWSTTPSDELSVSCATGASCAATGRGTYRTYAGGQWTAPQDFYRASGLQDFGSAGGGALSCVSSSFCVDGNGARGQYALLNGETWSYGLQLLARAGGGVGELDCQLVTFCAMRLSYQLSSTIRGIRWYVVNGHARTVFSASSDAAVSCWAPYACMLMSPRSYFFTRRG